jgi:hypothetical protein
MTMTTNEKTPEPQGTYKRVGGWSLMQWPPFDIQKVTYYNYVIDADINALTRLCDAFFNNTSGGAVQYKPLIPQIIFSYANIEEATSSDPRAGSTPERDILLWTPVVRLGPEGHSVIAVPIFSPFVFVDNAVAVQLGREMFGFPKNWCQLLTKPDSPSSTEGILVHAYTKPADEEVLAPRKILNLKCTGTGPEPKWIHGAVEVIEEILSIAKTFITDENGLGLVKNAEAIAVATASLLQMEQSFCFLKQFPSMSNDAMCCYQSIGEMASKLGAIKRFGVLTNEYELEYVDDMFHHFKEAFGWADGPLKVRAAFYMDFSFTIVSGKVVWQAVTPG